MGEAPAGRSGDAPPGATRWKKLRQLTRLIAFELRCIGEANPYGGQADWICDRPRRLRETSQVTDLAASGPYSPSQGGPATVVGIRITNTSERLAILRARIYAHSLVIRRPPVRVGRSFRPLCRYVVFR